MKRFLFVFVLILAVTAVMPAFAEEKRVDSKIRFSDLYGEVDIRPDAEEDDAYETAEFNTIIYDEDRIRTNTESGAILSLEDMSTYVIKPESILVIRSEKKNVSKMEMLAGCIIGNVKKMVEGKSKCIEMSQCVAGIKRTTFQLYQSPDGTVNSVDVAEGLIEVTMNKDKSVYKVAAGQSLTVKSGKITTSDFNGETIIKEIQDSKEKTNTNTDKKNTNEEQINKKTIIPLTIQKKQKNRN